MSKSRLQKRKGGKPGQRAPTAPTTDDQLPPSAQPQTGEKRPAERSSRSRGSASTSHDDSAGRRGTHAERKARAPARDGQPALREETPDNRPAYTYRGHDDSSMPSSSDSQPAKRVAADANGGNDASWASVLWPDSMDVEAGSAPGGSSSAASKPTYAEMLAKPKPTPTPTQPKATQPKATQPKATQPPKAKLPPVPRFDDNDAYPALPPPPPQSIA